jgi:hypothetical protein
LIGDIWDHRQKKSMEMTNRYFSIQPRQCSKGTKELKFRGMSVSGPRYSQVASVEKVGLPIKPKMRR